MPKPMRYTMGETTGGECPRRIEHGWTRHHHRAVWVYMAAVVACAVLGGLAEAFGLCDDGWDLVVSMIAGLALMGMLLNRAELRAREGRGG